MKERIYWLCWQTIMPGSARRIWQLYKAFGSLKAAWEASDKEIQSLVGTNSRAAEALLKARSCLDPIREIDELNKIGAEYITYKDPNYPENLKSVYDPPPVLFVLGKILPVDKLAVALVGARKASSYGLAVAQKLAGELAKVGITVVSGMARGIDSASHKGSLLAQGRTVAVLGSGLNVVYPRENRKLLEEISSSGAVITEFPLGSKPEAWHFPMRNRVISGLTRATVVVEAAQKSGALITADFALEQGREVMAVPGSIGSPLSRGPHQLIKQGAKLVENVQDILEELGITSLFPEENTHQKMKIKLNKSEDSVLKIVTLEPIHFDEIVYKSNLPAQQVLSTLMLLELKGLIRQLPGRYYASSEVG
ncbi:DNA-processing protein DprA [Desulfolucanica intricata]|uniref:DNA-processing protein DprA n=1 Tax=Desulfolucanica intricata TaxID=1285191 RepID=UPI00082F08AC|nr:DNA-processing protein DprA [Desulfolucanica intricata]